MVNVRWGDGQWDVRARRRADAFAFILTRWRSGPRVPRFPVEALEGKRDSNSVRREPRETCAGIQRGAARPLAANDRHHCRRDGPRLGKSRPARQQPAQ
jgi:hypothetical protein